MKVNPGISLEWTLLLALGLLQLAPARSALADDCKACERYLDLVPQYSLAENVVAIGAAALHQEGHAFNVDAQLADKLLQQIQNDKRIPLECRAYVKSSIHIGPRYSVIALGWARDKPPGFSMNTSTASDLMSMFNKMVASYDPCSRPGKDASTAADASYAACLQKNAGGAYNKFSDRLANGTTQQLIGQLGNLGVTATADDVAMLKAYSQALNSGSEAGLLNWAAAAGKKLTTDQFLNVVQMTGWEMNASYNQPRADGVGNAGDGSITVDQALASMRTNTMFMITDGRKDPGGALADFEVICRDAAIVQTRMLEAGGFPNSYAVAYRSASGGHVDVITQDPKDPLKLYTLNWSGRATHQGLDGSSTLFQGSGMGIPDYSMTYVVSDSSGKNVAMIPSAMGKFLNEASGGDVRTYDPLARAQNSMIAVGISPDSKGIIQARALTGTDGNGAQYTGVAANGSWALGTNFPGSAGIFFGQQFRPSSVYGAKANGTVLVGYGQLEQHAITSQLTLAPHVTGVLDAHVAAAGQFTVITSGPDHSDTESNVNGNYDHRIGAEVRVNQTALGGRLKAEYVAGANMAIGMADVRNEDASAIAAIPLGVYAGARATLKTGDVTVFGQAMVAVDQLGIRNRVEAGIATRVIAASVFEAGRVTHGTALIQDGTIRRAGVSFADAPSKHLRFGLTGEIPLEGDVGAGASVYGTGAVLF
ncbi:MAG: hypothetical protein HY074_13475 [Deltaproteobacteria bacterium]|nr:hypothetical protein [Deltaproteobacteria bacterium]